MKNDDENLDQTTSNELSEDATEEQMFNEFAEGTAGDQPRDEQGRFSSNEEPDDEPDGEEEDLSEEAADEQQEEPSEVDQIRKEMEDWKHRFHSDLGRQNALQRKIQDLETENSKLKNNPQPSGDNPEGSGMSDAKWKTFKEDFPEFAEVMEMQDQRHKQELQSLREQVGSQLEPIQSRAQEQYKQTQFQILESQHPGWVDVVKSSEFHQWLQEQPEAVQSLSQSDEAADAAYLMSSYKLQNQPQANDELQQRRKRHLERSRTVPSRGPRQRTAISEDDEEALFNHYADQ